MTINCWRPSDNVTPSLSERLLGKNKGQYFPNILTPKKEMNKTPSLKLLFENKGSFNNQGSNKKVLTLRKNMSIFSTGFLTAFNKRMNTKFGSTGDLFSSGKSDSNSINKTFKRNGKSIKDKERFLLIEKARPYRYMKVYESKKYN